MQFKHIDEIGILYLANCELMRKISAELEKQKAYPQGTIAQRLIDKYTAQADEIHARILELEATK